jgi:hypothetical protein
MGKEAPFSGTRTLMDTEAIRQVGSCAAVIAAMPLIYKLVWVIFAITPY